MKMLNLSHVFLLQLSDTPHTYNNKLRHILVVSKSMEKHHYCTQIYMVANGKPFPLFFSV
jgi:hypothetical protein